MIARYRALRRIAQFVLNSSPRQFETRAMAPSEYQWVLVSLMQAASSRLRNLQFVAERVTNRGYLHHWGSAIFNNCLP